MVARGVAPRVAPLVAVSGGWALGGLFAGVGRFLFGRKVNDGEYEKLKKERKKLESGLNTHKTDLSVKQKSIESMENTIESEE